MDFNLADYAQQMDPMQRQKLMVEMVRAGQQSKLAEANTEAHRFDNLASAAPLMNNPALVQSTGIASKNAAAQYKPVQMGQQGFMTPGTGEFVESPMYQDEKNAAREQQTRMQEDRQQQAKYVLAESIAARKAQNELFEEGRRDRAHERNVLTEAMAAMRAGQGNTRAADKADAKAQSDLEKGVSKYSNTLEKAGVPEFSQALGLVEGTLGKYKPGELPGYGRLAGAVPNALSTTEMQVTRTNMQQAANILLKSRSGAAVTDSEMRRFLTEVAMGAGMSEQAMRNGWANVRKTFDAKRGAIAAGASPEVHEEFTARGGEDYRPKSKRVKFDAQGNEVPQ